MTYKPFTFEEAEDIREDFEDLIDTDFKIDRLLVYEVNNVLVCPFPEDAKQAFVLSYHTTRDAGEALAGFKGDEYDVIVFAYNIADSEDYLVVDIRTFAHNKGINYNFP